MGLSYIARGCLLPNETTEEKFIIREKKEKKFPRGRRFFPGFSCRHSFRVFPSKFPRVIFQFYTTSFGAVNFHLFFCITSFLLILIIIIRLHRVLLFFPFFLPVPPGTGQPGKLKRFLFYFSREILFLSRTSDT